MHRLSHPLLIFYFCISVQSCAQNSVSDTAEAFAARLQKALASPTPSRFDNDIIISTKEHREWCEMKVRIEFSDNPIQDEAFLEQTADERHQFEWEHNQESFQFQLRENWNPKFNDWKAWENTRFVEVKIDTSAALFGKGFAKNPMKNIEIGLFSAKYKLPEEDFYRKIQTVVCSISGGRWKVVRYISLGERSAE